MWLGRIYNVFDVCHFFFFSSRRRHTRFDCDWSSDVCSSDLHQNRAEMPFLDHLEELRWRILKSLVAVLLASMVGWVIVEYRSEEHTSELQSQSNLVCRLLLEKKKKKHHSGHICEQLTAYKMHEITQSQVIT